jgi:hypothetical protein
MRIYAVRLRVEKSKLISVIRATEETRPKRFGSWRQSVDVTRLSSGGGPSPGFVRFYKPIQPMNWSSRKRIHDLDRGIRGFRFTLIAAREGVKSYSLDNRCDGGKLITAHEPL